jgi:hypothetical protein
MAFAAVPFLAIGLPRREGTLVIVVMAGGTILVRYRLNEASGMAFAAVDFLVLAFEVESGEAVVELTFIHRTE